MIFTFFGGFIIGTLINLKDVIDEKKVNENLYEVINNLQNVINKLINKIKILENEKRISTEVSEIMHNSGTIVDKFDKIKELIDRLDKPTNSKTK